VENTFAEFAEESFIKELEKIMNIKEIINEYLDWVFKSKIMIYHHLLVLLFGLHLFIKKTMIPIYKIVKISKPHCSICKEMLLGNGSIVLPYWCRCGEWKVDIETGGI